MKKIQTTVKTGDKLIYNGRTCSIGLWKHGLITFHTSVSATSGITEMISTRELNKRLLTATLVS